MTIDAKTIQIFLPDGQPRGIRIAEITTRIVQAIAVPRTRLDQFFSRPEADRVALYFLFGDRGESAKPMAYIGQTEDLITRLRKHNATKEFWKVAVIITSKTQSFTQAHIKYLEWQSISKAAEVNRYTLDNGNAGTRPHVPEPLEADVLDAFETASTLLGTLGYPIFEPLAGTPGTGEQTDADDIFFIKGAGEEGRGKMVDDGFVVFAGSTSRREMVPSAADWIRRTQEELLSADVIVEADGQLRFAQDYVFDTPTGAAAIVVGRNANGWLHWKNAEGKTLHDVYRENVDDRASGT